MTLMEITKSVIRLIRQKPFTYETRTIFNKEMEETTNERSKKSKQ